MVARWFLTVVVAVLVCVGGFSSIPSAAAQGDDIDQLLERVRAATADADAQADRGDDGEAADIADAFLKTRYVGWLKLSGPLRDSPPPFAWVDESALPPSMAGVLKQLDHVAESDSHHGLVIYLDQPMLGLSQIEELTNGIAELRKKGKKVLVFAEAYDLPSYLIACAGDSILLQRKGMVELSGLGIEEMYLAGLLEKIGVKADMMQVGAYKGAAEALTRTGPSKEWDENFDKLLDDMWALITEQIIASRPKITKDNLNKVIAASLGMTDEQLVEAGLVDQLVERNLASATKTTFGESFVYDENMGTFNPRARVDNPFALFSTLFQEPGLKVTRPSLAVIHAHGAIHSGDSTYGAAGETSLFASDSIGSRTMVEALATARDNDLIKGVVIRIDSPGGSAIASEVIWQAVRGVAANKPVFVSIGPMAASGGYYIACAGDRIYVTGNSIVGSIGVVGGKIVLGDLYNKLGIAVHRRTRGANGDMFNSVEPFTAEQRARLHDAFQNVYNTFTDRVKAGRGGRIKDIDQVAHGRLFTGRQCVSNGLADEVGNLDDALHALAARCELVEDAYDVVNLPTPMSLQEYLNGMFGAGVAAPKLSADQLSLLQSARTAVGPQAWQAVQRSLTGILLLREERALTLLPNVFVIR